MDNIQFSLCFLTVFPRVFARDLLSVHAHSFLFLLPFFCMFDCGYPLPSLLSLLVVALRQRPSDYYALKEKIAQSMINGIFLKHFPQLADKVCHHLLICSVPLFFSSFFFSFLFVSFLLLSYNLSSFHTSIPICFLPLQIVSYECSTPLTTCHYLNVTRGESFGLDLNRDRLMATVLGPRSPIRNLWMTGQDVFLPGVAFASISGVLCAMWMSPLCLVRTLATLLSSSWMTTAKFSEAPSNNSITVTQDCSMTLISFLLTAESLSFLSITHIGVHTLHPSAPLFQFHVFSCSVFPVLFFLSSAFSFCCPFPPSSSWFDVVILFFLACCHLVSMHVLASGHETEVCTSVSKETFSESNNMKWTFPDSPVQFILEKSWMKWRGANSDKKRIQREDTPQHEKKSTNASKTVNLS